MIICLVLAGYLLAGLIVGLIHLNHTKEVLPAMLKELGLNSPNEYFTNFTPDATKRNDMIYIACIGTVFYHTNLGFLILVLTWPTMAVAMICDLFTKKGSR